MCLHGKQIILKSYPILSGAMAFNYIVDTIIDRFESELIS